MLGAFAGAALGSSLGCATSSGPAPPRLLRRREAGLDLALSFPRDDERAARWLPDAASSAARRVASYELRLDEPVLIRLHPDVAGFVKATGQTRPWLRAWAGYATIDLLPLRYWKRDDAPIRAQRLAHELTHCCLYQTFGSEARARQARIPWWLSEGAASVVAGQGARRLPLERVREQAGDRVLLDEDGLLAADHHLAYGAAHHAVSALVEAEGRDVLRRIFDEAARRPASPGVVERALASVTGLEAAALWRTTLDDGQPQRGEGEAPARSSGPSSGLPPASR